MRWFSSLLLISVVIVRLCLGFSITGQKEVMAWEQFPHLLATFDWTIPQKVLILLRLAVFFVVELNKRLYNGRFAIHLGCPGVTSLQVVRLNKQSDW